MVAYPNFDKLFVVETAVSSFAVGAILLQKDDGGNVHQNSIR